MENAGIRHEIMLELYRWRPPELTVELVQERIGEAVTGIVSLDNLLIICQHFGVLPPEVICVEVEPVETEFGLEMSAIVASRFEEAVMLVRYEALSVLRARDWGLGADRHA